MGTSQEHRELAIALKQARMAAGLTQSQASAKLSRPQSYIAKVESGEKKVDAIELKRLAEAYGKSIADFFE